MPEFNVQVLYAVLITSIAVSALAVAVVRFTTENSTRLWAWLTYKPFSCVYCMTWWLAVILTPLCVINDPPTTCLLIPVVHVLAFAFYNKVL